VKGKEEFVLFSNRNVVLKNPNLYFCTLASSIAQCFTGWSVVAYNLMWLVLTSAVAQK